MANFDRDAFEERAAIMEYDGAVSRFRAESQAARAQGLERWEAIGNIAGRMVERARDHRAAMDGQQRPDNMPGVQPASAEKARRLPERYGDG